MNVPSERVQQAIAGDLVALQLLLLDCYAPLVQHVTPRIAGRYAADMAPEDIVQEACTHVFRDIRSLKADSWPAFWAWVVQIAENRLRDAVKALNRDKRPSPDKRVGAMRPDSDGSYLNLFDELHGSDPTPSRLVRAEERVALLRIAVASLPDLERRAVELRYLEERSVAETAQLMSKTEDAVLGLCKRAKERLVERIGSASQILSQY